MVTNKVLAPRLAEAAAASAVELIGAGESAGNYQQQLHHIWFQTSNLVSRETAEMNSSSFNLIVFFSLGDLSLYPIQ